VLLACLAAALVIVPAVNAQDANRIPCSADRLTMYMPDQNVYKFLEDLGYCAPTLAEEYVTFWVRSSNDARLLLTETYGQWEGQTEIQLGYESWGLWTGTVCHAAILDAAWTDGICYLNSDEWRQFWVSWSDGKVEVGTGGDVGENTFLSANKNQKVNYLAVYTNWGAHGNFAFGYNPTEVKCGDATGKSMVYAEEVYWYRYLEEFGLCVDPTADSIQFWLMAANDAHITLADSNDQDDEITFNPGVGSNSELSVFNYGGKQVSMGGTFLAVGVWKPFWISWTETDMAIGKGTVVGEDQIAATAKSADQEVNFIGICSDWWARSQWAFGYDKDPAEEQTVEFSLNTAVKTPGMSAEGATCYNTITEIQACIDLCVDKVVNEGCFGIDWNHSSNPWNGCRCWIHPTYPGALSANSNVDHYMPG